jgi:rare lipoprotein A
LSPHTPQCGRVRAYARRAAAISWIAAAVALAPPAFAQESLQAEQAPAETVDARYSRHVLVNRPARVWGTVSSGQSGREVLVQVRRRGRWSTVARATTRDGGTFSTTYRVRSTGRLVLRVRLADAAPAATTADSEPVTVYRRSFASWYGPGFYGRRLACGGRLRYGQIGVAHKRLRCGTRVTLRYRGRTVIAPVIDRGPYVGGREFDLTAATKRRLRFPSTGTLWASP